MVELARRDPRRGRRGRPRPGHRGRRGDHDRHPGHARGLPGPLRLLVPRAHASTTARPAPWSARSRCWRSRATPTAPRARCGCARRSSATTRTACSCAPDGETTYFANDVAYHENKLERGYDRMINLLGSDHHGYIARMKASMAALGIDPDRLEIPILQFVHIVEGAAPRLDVQAPRRLRDARRPDRRDRRRRHALLHAQPLARLDRRPRRRAGQVAGEGQPGLLRAVPPRALRLDPAPGRGSRRAVDRASSSTRPSAS